jgi:hypothetical protein
MPRRLLPSLTAAVIALASAAPGQPKDATTRPAGKAVKYKVKQCAAFVALARKAAGLKGVHAKGYVLMLRGAKGVPADRKETKFETWTTPTLAKSRMTQGERDAYLVYDWKHAYQHRGGGRGWRRNVTEERFYDRLEIASVYCDASRGYTNLGNAGEFKPIGGIEEYDKKIPGLKWFEVVGDEASPSRFLRQFVTLKFGLSAADGLVRVMYVESKDRPAGDGKPPQRYETVIVMEHVTHKALKGDDLKFPAGAATAKWTDRDTDKDIDPPNAVIAAKAAAKPAAGKEIKYKVKQVDAFVALARKAAGLKGVHVQGRFEMLSGPPDMPADQRKMTFETWTSPTLAKSVIHERSRGGYIVYDGKHVYAFRGPSRGRRTKLTEENFYEVLEIASINCDAARGYTNLGDATKFVPIPAIEEHDKKVPGLKWFQVTGGKDKKHPFFQMFETIKLGISPADGLVRVMYVEGRVRGGRVEVKPDGREVEVEAPAMTAPPQDKAVMIVEKVTHKALKADDFKLPAEAAAAKWRDSDTGKEIDPPKALIAKPAKTKTEK